MSRLFLPTLKTNLIPLNSQGLAEFQLQICTEAAAVESPVLFKIMTNSKLNLTITPSNGILMNQGGKGKRSISLQFAGNSCDLEKTLIQIRWISLRSHSELFPELQSVLVFTDFYRKCSSKYEEQKLELKLDSCGTKMELVEEKRWALAGLLETQTELLEPTELSELITK